MYFAPGRINLIGEHIDYNGGLVMPCAIDKGTYLSVTAYKEPKLRLYSCSHGSEGFFEIELQSLQCGEDAPWILEKSGRWIDYPLGVFRMFAERGFFLQKGVTFHYWSDLPQGAGFSSSASIEMVTALALNDLTGAGLNRKELALLCQQAENIHIGVQCGIMDQFAAAFGKKDHAILLNTDTLEYQYLPVKLPGVRLVAVNTNKARSLADGKYNWVRHRNHEAQRILGAVALCGLTEEEIRKERRRLEKAGLYGLARHMVTENARVLEVKSALEAGDTARLGTLLNASHASLKDDLGVSCKELDVLAETASALEGVLGARMMGGGFGGCILALVKEESIRNFREALAKAYREKTGKTATFYEALVIGGGAAGQRLHDYPRPNLKRDSFINLNGPWQYAITKEELPPKQYHGSIMVPYSPEAALSGVGRQLQPDEYLHYRLRYVLDEESAALLREDRKRLLLHFGAADQSCRVFVNDKEAGSHRGGYLPFSIDITDFIKGSEVELKVAVRDISDTGYETVGKQKLQPGGMYYTAQSGIWQTVWMELVPKERIEKLELRADIDKGEISLVVSAADALTAAGRTAKVTIMEMAAEVPLNEAAAIKIPQPVLWSPEQPYLYDIKVETAEDAVTGYFAMRKVSLGKDEAGITRVFLNNRPYFVNGVLDQGYWREGLYTPPDEKTLYGDIDKMKALGFNCLRKHVKIEPLTWYHHCDKTGMLVMQDMVNGGRTANKLLVTYLPNIIPGIMRTMKDNKYKALRRDTEDSQRQFLEESRQTIENLRHFPCIVCWVPFNEGWGQFDSRTVTEFIKSLDDSRLIDSASGWFDRGCGDIYSIHNYFLPFHIEPQGERAVALTEYGGAALKLEEHFYGRKNYGYGRCQSKEALSAKYKAAFEEKVLDNIPKGLCMSIYTQLSDIEDEINGIYTYDREVLKFEKDVLVELNEKINDMNAAAAKEGAAKGE